VLVDGVAKRKRNNGFRAAALDAAKKHKSDALLYLDHEAVANAVVDMLGDKDGSACMTFLEFEELVFALVTGQPRPSYRKAVCASWRASPRVSHVANTARGGRAPRGAHCLAV
jgi:hypothetical protein